MLPGFKTLLKRLKGSQCAETLSEIEISSRLKRKGFEIELYPKLASGKEADVKSTRNNEEFWWEVTTTMESGHEENALRTWFALNRLPNGDVNVRFKIYRSLSRPEIIKYSDLINQKIHEVESGSGFEEIHVPGILDYYIAKDDQFHRIPEEMQGSLSIPLQTDWGQRIVGKIGGKLCQLPPDKFGIIAIFNNLCFEDLDRNLIRQVQETIEPYEQVYSVFITMANLSPGEECERESDGHLLIQRIRYGALLERTFVIKSKSYPVDEHLINIYR